MNAFQGYLEKLGGNFLVASFIPSLAFVIASIVSFGPIIPERVLLRIQFLLNPLGEFGIVVILIAVIIGFTLTSLNTQVYKFFEGYVGIDKLTAFRTQEIQRAQTLRDERDRLTRKIARLKTRLTTWEEAKLPDYAERKTNIRNKIQALRAQRDSIITIYDQNYPPGNEHILPTRLGNILRAAEIYPLTRYSIDSVPMWPRIMYAASISEKGENFLAKVDFSNDQCSFLLNASLLSGLYAGLALMASIYQYFILLLSGLGIEKLLYFIPIYQVPEVYTQRAALYLILFVSGLWGMWFFYRASLWNVSAYGNLIRSTYDLFRFPLLEVLHLPLPVNNDDDTQKNKIPANLKERFVWRKVSDMMNTGWVHFDYSHPDKHSE